MMQSRVQNCWSLLIQIAYDVVSKTLPHTLKQSIIEKNIQS